jgi:hypothetical protein
MTAKSNPSSNGKTRKRREWAPTHDDEFIYWWVKFRGESQTIVGNQMGIHQTTVSRIIDRYERWQARAAPREGGRLDHAERLRAQRWLTYERNELILASCLKLAEQATYAHDVTKTTTSRPLSNPDGERELRHETTYVDFSGGACRFLRLAFRVNMEQHKLAAMDDLPPLPPLSAEELAEEERAAAAASDALASARNHGDNMVEELERRAQERKAEMLAAEAERALQLKQATRLQRLEAAERAELAAQLLRQLAEEEPTGEDGQETGDSEQETGDSEQETGDTNQEQDAPAAELDLHNLHNDAAEESTASVDPESTCATTPRAEKSARQACMTPPAQSHWPADKEPQNAKTRGSGGNGSKRRSKHTSLSAVT